MCARAASQVPGNPEERAGNGGSRNGPPSPERRRLATALLGTGLISTIVSFFYPVARYLIPVMQEESMTAVTAAKISDLKLNSGRIFKFGSRPGLLVRTSGGTWKAFLAVCPHLNCTVQYRSETQQIWCACHNGTFDLNGQVISGPPPKPLEEFEVNVRGDEVIVSRSRRA
ncbi:MAG: Rieske (2Fe-2S) protein [Acidobacteria bacterium]|nr:Rieske (2Fe-2S) protein [Acidobacteriota bacterium]